MANEETLTGADSLPFEPVSDEVRANVEDLQMSLVSSGKKKTTDALLDIAVVNLERVNGGSLLIRNHPSGELTGTGLPAGTVITKVVGSIDGGKTFDVVVSAEETTPFIVVNTNKLVDVNPINTGGFAVAGVAVTAIPKVLTHLKVQARAAVGGTQGTVSVRGAFNMQG